MSSLVVLTGASGSGKTTLARAIQQACPPHCEVLFFDSVGVPSAEAMRAFGDGHQPGGAWQRATTIQWMEHIAAVMCSGLSVLFEGQMRIGFIHEALALFGIKGARIVLIDCDDSTRAGRLHLDRNQPELATLDMMAWARYLRDEALQAGCEILDTGTVPFKQCQDRILQLITTS